MNNVLAVGALSNGRGSSEASKAGGEKGSSVNHVGEKELVLIKESGLCVNKKESEEDQSDLYICYAVVALL